MTEFGSKDTVLGAGAFLSPDPSTCGAAAESDGYAIRILADTAVALAYGADGLSTWEVADPSWACSRGGMVDTAGTPRRFHEPLAPVAETVTTTGWYRHDVTVSAFPAGTRQLRVTLPAAGDPPSNPQLGDLTLRWHLDTPATLPRGPAPWTLDLPADSAVVLVLAR